MATAERRGGGVIPKLLRRHGLHLMSFGFIAGYKKNTNATWDEAATEFKRHFGLSDEDITNEAIIREAQRMTVEYLNEGL